MTEFVDPHQSNPGLPDVIDEHIETQPFGVEASADGNYPSELPLLDGTEIAQDSIAEKANEQIAPTRSYNVLGSVVIRQMDGPRPGIGGAVVIIARPPFSHREKAALNRFKYQPTQKDTDTTIINLNSFPSRVSADNRAELVTVPLDRILKPNSTTQQTRKRLATFGETLQARLPKRYVELGRKMKSKPKSKSY